MFGEPKHKKYADIVSLKSVNKAKESVEKLKKESRTAKTRAKKVRVKRVTVNASNRARASAKRKGLSWRERRQLRKIANVYEKGYKSKDMRIPDRTVSRRVKR